MHSVSRAIENVERKLAQLGHDPALLAIPELYAVLGDEQRELWDRTENDFEQAVAGSCEIVLSVAAEQYEFVMGELIDFAARKVRHARVEHTLREDCWSAREEG